MLQLCFIKKKKKQLLQQKQKRYEEENTFCGKFCSDCGDLILQFKKNNIKNLQEGLKKE